MSTKRWWPVVFWFQEYKDPYLIYKPSWSHHHGRLPKAYNTYEGALRYCLNMIGTTDMQRMVFTAMPTFIPYVIEGDKPRTDEFATLRLHVQRINVNDDD